MYETFDHTADLGLRIRAAELDSLFSEAAKALFATIVEDLSTVQPRQQIDLEIPGDERDFLLFDWLKELLYRFDSEHMLFSRFEVHVDASGLKGTAWGNRSIAAGTRFSTRSRPSRITGSACSRPTTAGWRR